MMKSPQKTNVEFNIINNVPTKANRIIGSLKRL